MPSPNSVKGLVASLYCYRKRSIFCWCLFIDFSSFHFLHWQWISWNWNLCKNGFRLCGAKASNIFLFVTVRVSSWSFVVSNRNFEGGEFLDCLILVLCIYTHIPILFSFQIWHFFLEIDWGFQYTALWCSISTFELYKILIHSCWYLQVSYKVASIHSCWYLHT